ncbi:proline-rich protein 2-like [Cricetulus griseus]|uniref:Proline-rich protein 2-like n=1 Tax=Cricetulus griseus TaxID=10029 RepID=A0A9J7G8M8_CRIGR|nr:proline-rich protein 2-like [Cricetulus griseus]
MPGSPSPHPSSRAGPAPPAPPTPTPRPAGHPRALGAGTATPGPGGVRAGLRAGESLDVGKSPSPRRGRGAGWARLGRCPGAHAAPASPRPVRPPGPHPPPVAIGWPPAGAARSYLGERPGCTLVPAPRDASEPWDPGQVRPRRPPGGAEGEREREGEPRRRPLVETRRMQRPPGRSAAPRRAEQSRRRPPGRTPASREPAPRPDRAPPSPAGPGGSVSPAAGHGKAPGGVLLLLPALIRAKGAPPGGEHAPSLPGGSAAPRHPWQTRPCPHYSPGQRLSCI